MNFGEFTEYMRDFNAVSVLALKYEFIAIVYQALKDEAVFGIG